MNPDQLPFPAMWYAADLAQYRPCDGTYCPYPYDSLPPIPIDLRGDFAWLDALPAGGFSPTEPTHEEDKLAALIAQAGTLNLTLPPEFVTFMRRADWQRKVPSCTACWFTLPESIVKHPAADGYVIRFLNDQQDVLFWYLYLTPQGDQAVVCSWLPFDYEGVLDGDTAAYAADPQQTWFVAPDFETFIYRFWIENDLWFRLDDGGSLTPEQQRYVAAYGGSQR